jgi:AcrR family transcriptional regulator
MARTEITKSAAKKKPKPRKKVTRPRGETRGRILACAVHCFEKNGVSHTTITEIAHAAGVPHTLVLYHFPTLDILYLEAVRSILDEMVAVSVAAIENKAGEPMEALDAYLRAPFLWAQKNHAKFALWIYFYSMAAVSKRFRELNDTIRAGGRARISALLFEAIARGRLSHDAADIPRLSYLVQCLITGVIVQTASESGYDYVAAADTISDGVAALLGY